MKVSVIAKNLAFFKQLNIIYFFFLKLTYFLFFISHNIFISKFQDIKIIVPQIILDRYKKKILILDIISTQKKSIIVFKEILAMVCNVIKDLAFSLIQFVIYICLWIFKYCFAKAKIVFKSLILKFN